MEISEALIDEYLESCKIDRGLSVHTLRAYKCDLLQFLDWSQKAHKNELNRNNIKTYVSLLKASYSSKTAKRKYASIKALMTYLYDENEHPGNPLLGFRAKFNTPFTLPRVIPLDELSKILETSESENASDFWTIRNHTIVEMLISTGIRVSELCAININDFDLRFKTLTIKGKGNKERTVQLECQQSFKLLVEYINARIELHLKQDAKSADIPLFVNRFGSRLSDQSVRKIIRKISRDAGIVTTITPHMFRHTFATTLLEEGVDIRYIQKILGHSSIRTTEIYTHVSESKQREILRMHNPRDVIRRRE